MKEKLTSLLMRHIDLMDASIRSTNKLLTAASKGDISSIEEESDNRERLIKVIDRFQKFIEEEIQQLAGSQIDATGIDILKTWAYEVHKWVDKTERLDQEISEQLESLREETSKEISTIFKSRQQFKGYNLNNLKK
ncbi:hypothetical protein HBN50_16075 [Halobacteriovorax sp. GB3]|uniref:hypothetical protein n=1 Tax=Halobacteriovorax sp. GB3 TaxID=2719615 RepID=UPI00235DEB85|nr:hypothetical protein [Halobacteriovorax sp. GB3]MDD0854631.1 hypothetical protein [Halobacteriovorax sp. GB3]